MQQRGQEWLRAALAVIVVALVLYLLSFFVSFNGWPGIFGGPDARDSDEKLGIIIHHSASPPVLEDGLVDAGLIDRMHAQRGFQVEARGQVYHIGYHFVVLQDGTVQEGRPLSVRGAHAGSRYYNDRYIGICLVGDYDPSTNRWGRRGPAVPPQAQLAAARDLCARLCRRYGFGPEHVLPHSDVAHTLCPGRRFPLAEFRESVARELKRGSWSAD
jgi:N-acetylmuramoyl-L-alanine amidase